MSHFISYCAECRYAGCRYAEFHSVTWEVVIGQAEDPANVIFRIEGGRIHHQIRHQIGQNMDQGPPGANFIKLFTAVCYDFS